MKILRMDDAIFKQGSTTCGWYWPNLKVKFLKSNAVQPHIHNYFNRVNQSIVFRVDGEGTPESYWPLMTTTLLDYGILCEPLTPTTCDILELPSMDMS